MNVTVMVEGILMLLMMMMRMRMKMMRRMVMNIIEDEGDGGQL